MFDEQKIKEIIKERALGKDYGGRLALSNARTPRGVHDSFWHTDQEVIHA